MDLANLADLEVDAAIVDTGEQQREEWFRLRAGKFTCSRFGDLIGTGRRKEDEFSQTAWGYIYKVAAERLGSWEFEFDNASVRWGRENEQAALLAYLKYHGILSVDNFVTGTATFHQINDYTAGTPDALVDDCGCVEVKCPYTPQEHMRTIHENKVPDRYVWQVQGHLLVTGRQWCDYVSFDPRLSEQRPDKAIHVIRVEPVEAMQNTLRERLQRANEVVCEIIGE